MPELPGVAEAGARRAAMIAKVVPSGQADFVKDIAPGGSNYMSDKTIKKSQTKPATRSDYSVARDARKD